MTVVPQGGGTISRGGGGGSGNLYDILELILDRGLVIDVFVRVSLVGIEILKIDARIVVASVDTYLRFAEACNRLDLEEGRKAPSQLTDLVGEVTEGGAHGKTKGALSGAAEVVTDALKGGHDDEDEESEERRKEPEERRERPRRRPAARRREE
ncbi:gas vesicle structural protein GvpA [Streptomyces sp. NBC_01724]|uniref:gas vesicle structural protein GvpA n=1 Tax=Streptomyces TaxID=1883 RepID=UPI002DDA593F|nr:MULTISPECIES: gas vesicle structural protein GvpA [unclassified Streptomyces]WSC73804.1 gas vesicle structural protein GvpA [Streptomyces sp. NBC_01760]WTE56116.1 gas vesicle structural protein GvpA [Streptomyces sp. NBC_01620]WTE64188.1 gas vesicle structural protein GvpA [Streptomyces sp. NBC_01617]WTI91476.1 gas vesicle structural protein GvpA [Streptomyces sp. NBC_00724]